MATATTPTAAPAAAAPLASVVGDHASKIADAFEKMSPAALAAATWYERNTIIAYAMVGADKVRYWKRLIAFGASHHLVAVFLKPLILRTLIANTFMLAITAYLYGDQLLRGWWIGSAFVEIGLLLQWLWLVPVEDVTMQDYESHWKRVDDAREALEHLKGGSYRGMTSVDPDLLAQAERKVSVEEDAFNHWLLVKIGPSNRSFLSGLFRAWLFPVIQGDTFLYNALWGHTYRGFSKDDVRPVLFIASIYAVLYFFLPLMVSIFITHFGVGWAGTKIERLLNMLRITVVAAYTPNETATTYAQKEIIADKDRGNDLHAAMEVMSHHYKKIAIAALVAGGFQMTNIWHWCLVPTTKWSMVWGLVAAFVAFVLYYRKRNMNIRSEEGDMIVEDGKLVREGFTLAYSLNVFVFIHFFVMGGAKNDYGTDPTVWFYAGPLPWLWNHTVGLIHGVGQLELDPTSAAGHLALNWLNLGVAGAVLFALAGIVVLVIPVMAGRGASGVIKATEEPMVKWILKVIVAGFLGFTVITATIAMIRSPNQIHEIVSSNAAVATQRRLTTTCQKNIDGQFPCTTECFQHWHLVPHRRANGSLEDPACHY